MAGLWRLQPALALAAVVSGDPPPPGWPPAGALAAGQPAAHWLAKPVRPMQLRALLMNALPPPVSRRVPSAPW